MIKKNANDIQSILYRMDKKTWARLTHLKADGKIKSYQSAIDVGLSLLLKKIDKPGGQQPLY